MQIQRLQILLIVPKTIQAIFFLINILLLTKKYKGIPWKKRPQLNRLFIIGLTGWFVYITFDIFIYIIAGISFEQGHPPGTYLGYNSEYPSLFITNILRDIGMTGAFVIAWCYLIASFNIRNGEKKTAQIFWQNKILLGLMASLTIVFVGYDIISVTVIEDGVIVGAVWDGVAGAALMVIIGNYIFAAIMMYKALYAARKEEKAKQTRRKILFLILGVFMMGFGNIYWLILGNAQIIYPEFFTENIKILFGYLGHFIWILSPLFIYLGLKKEKKTISKKTAQDLNDNNR